MYKSAIGAVFRTCLCASFVASPAHLPAQETRPPVLDNAHEVRETLFEEYTLEMRRKGLVGQPILEMMIGENGRAAEIRLVERSGIEALDRAARKVARKMKFEPARAHGEKVDQEVRLPLVFDSSCGVAPSIVEHPEVTDLRSDLDPRAIAEHPQPKRALLDVRSDADGRPLSAYVLESSGLAEADSLAVRQVLASRYAPVEWEGQRVPARYRSTVLPGITEVPRPDAQCSEDLEYPVLKNRGMLLRSMHMIRRGMEDSGRPFPSRASAVLWVRDDGRVGQVLVYESSCWDELDSYLKSIWMAAEFEPASCNGAPHAMYVALPLEIGFSRR